MRVAGVRGRSEGDAAARAHVRIAGVRGGAVTRGIATQARAAGTINIFYPGKCMGKARFARSWEPKDKNVPESETKEKRQEETSTQVKSERS